MSTISTPENCVIHNMAVAAASLTPNHKPNQSALEQFYSRLSQTDRDSYYAAAQDAMSRLANTTQQQWFDYYNQYMVEILSLINTNQDSATVVAISNMLATIGK